MQNDKNIAYFAVCLVLTDETQHCVYGFCVNVLLMANSRLTTTCDSPKTVLNNKAGNYS